jgi:peptidoglycan lytic transglycosylase
MIPSPKKEVRMAQPNLGNRLVPVIIICQLFLAFLTLPAQAEEQKSESTQLEQVVATPAATDGVTGTASYYARRYDGRRTRSGARYNPEKLTAAHPDLPMGSKVKVVNLTNDREVVVTVNDRCRRKRCEHIDLSRAAARKLGFFGKGLTRVRIIPLDADAS